MANTEHLAILQRGVAAWNRWRQADPWSQPDLSQARLAGAQLASVSFREANLSGAYLGDCDLTSADLAGANLAGATLAGANLTRANLSGADLTGANLRGAVFFCSRLTGAHCSGADFSGAVFSLAAVAEADLAGATLTGATGLVTSVTPPPPPPGTTHAALPRCAAGSIERPGLLAGDNRQDTEPVAHQAFRDDPSAIASDNCPSSAHHPRFIAADNGEEGSLDDHPSAIASDKREGHERDAGRGAIRAGDNGQGPEPPRAGARSIAGYDVVARAPQAAAPLPVPIASQTMLEGAAFSPRREGSGRAEPVTFQRITDSVHFSITAPKRLHPNQAHSVDVWAS
jgi:hypothetical protein